MSATALVSGKLFRDPERKTSSRGSDYAMATIREGQGDDVAWWRVFAFHTKTHDELLTLRSGDAVSVSGSFKAELYQGNGTPRVSLTITADRLISAKKAKREKAAVAGADRKSERQDAPGERPFDDGIGF